jgi:GH24 family phage-related lysozyme (muramidase)
MKKFTLTILLVALNFIIANNILYSTLFEGDTKQEQVREEIIDWNFNYEATIQYIKEHEGFNKGYAYYCAGGYKTIGYGHVIKTGEDFPSQITADQADELLRKDFNNALELVEINTDLLGTKKLAIAHFVFAKGIGNYLRSGLKNCIDNDLPIEEEILKWCYYSKPDGKKIKSDYSYNIRLWELEMYNKL